MEENAEGKIRYYVNNNNAGRKILISPIDEEKSKLIESGTPFWEAEIYPSQSIFFRLVFNLAAKNKKKFAIKENWQEFSLSDKEAICYFNDLPDRNNYKSSVKYSIGRSKGNSFINLDVKIQSNEIVKARNEEKEKYRVSLDIHIHDNNQNHYEEVECNNNIDSIIRMCSKRISESLRQFQELAEFSNEVLINSFIDEKSVLFKPSKYPNCFLSKEYDKSSFFPSKNYSAQKYLHEKVGGDWYRYSENGYRGFFRTESERERRKTIFIRNIEALGINEIKEKTSGYTSLKKSFYLKASQGGTVRISELTEENIRGVYTDNLNTCVVVVLLSKEINNKRRISLSHIDEGVDLDSLALEISFINGDSYNIEEFIIAFREDKDSKDLMEKIKTNFSEKFKINTICINKDKGFGIKVGNCNYLKEEVANPLYFSSAPDLDNRHAINMLNCFCDKGDLSRSLDIQYDGENWTAKLSLSSWMQGFIGNISKEIGSKIIFLDKISSSDYLKGYCKNFAENCSKNGLFLNNQIELQSNRLATHIATYISEYLSTKSITLENSENNRLDTFSPK